MTVCDSSVAGSVDRSDGRPHTGPYGYSAALKSTEPKDAITFLWEEAFETRDKCRTRLRLLQKKCIGLFAEQTTAYGVAKITGLCQHLRQQPEPIFIPAPEERKYIL
jgi:hypothetical protein